MPSPAPSQVKSTQLNQERVGREANLLLVLLYQWKAHEHAHSTMSELLLQRLQIEFEHSTYTQAIDNQSRSSKQIADLLLAERPRSLSLSLSLSLSS